MAKIKLIEFFVQHKTYDHSEKRSDNQTITKEIVTSNCTYVYIYK